jgi:hypothetical protein
LCEWPNGSVRAAEAATHENQQPTFYIVSPFLIFFSFPSLCVVLRIFNPLNPRYHFPFSYDDAEEAVVESLSQVQRQKSRQMPALPRRRLLRGVSGTGTPACAQLLRLEIIGWHTPWHR